MSKHTNADLAALAMWEEYKATPPNDEWAGMDNREPRDDQATFLAGVAAGRSTGAQIIDAAEMISAQLSALERVLSDMARARRTVGL